MTLTRAQVEALNTRSAFGLDIETAEVDGDNRRRIKGYANTFGVMRSRRIIHPQAVEDWLAKAGGAGLPLLAQHGEVGGFATIGRVDVLKVQRGKGLYFEATVAAGTELGDQAWALVSQKLLGSLSVGWMGTQARWVKADDKDLDPVLAKAMKTAGVSECYAFLAVELLEISLVDVGDDPGARLAASLQEQLGALLDEKLGALLKSGGGDSADSGVGRYEADTQTLIEAVTKGVRAALEGELTDFAAGLEERLADVIATQVDSLHAAYHDDDYEPADCSCDDDAADGGQDGGGDARESAGLTGCKPVPQEEGATIAALRERLAAVEKQLES